MKVMFSIFFIALSLLASLNLEVQAQTRESITNSIGMKLVLVSKGTFQMGSPPSEEYSEEDERQYEVTLSQDYYLGAFEVTQAQYQKVMNQNPSYFQGDSVAELHPQTGRVVKDVDSSNYPVEQVSWGDAVEFCRRLSELPEEKKAGRVYRLPTEAEWEYACRAGSTTAYSFGRNAENLGNYAWFANNSGSEEIDALEVEKRLDFDIDRVFELLVSNGWKTHPVGEKKPNEFGLYDMHGSVWEWCSDWYGEYPIGSAIDPTGALKPSGPLGVKYHKGRVSRGGSWFNDFLSFRSAFRNVSNPEIRAATGGFRVALTDPESTVVAVTKTNSIQQKENAEASVVQELSERTANMQQISESLKLVGKFEQGIHIFPATINLKVDGDKVKGTASIEGNVSFEIVGRLQGTQFSATTYRENSKWSTWDCILDVRNGTMTGTFKPESREDANQSDGTMRFRKDASL
jgi:formylglycine-generating enzyme required for sulfatase activity